MAVSGAAGANAAAAARAAEEARRRAEEARRRAEEARRRAEAARKAAAEAAKQAKAQAEQQKKLQEQASKLQERLKATKPEDTQAKNLKKTAEELHKKLASEKVQTEKAEKNVVDTQKDAKEAAERSQKAAAEATQRAKLAEQAKDKGEDFANEVIGRAERQLGKKLKEVDPADAKKALDQALNDPKGAVDRLKASAGGKLDEAKELARGAFAEEATANLKEALGRNAEKVLGDNGIVGRLQDAASRTADTLKQGVENIGDELKKSGESLEAKLKNVLRNPAEAKNLPADLKKLADGPLKAAGDLKGKLEKHVDEGKGLVKEAGDGLVKKANELKDRGAELLKTDAPRKVDGDAQKADKVSDKKPARAEDRRVERPADDDKKTARTDDKKTERKDPKQAAREAHADDKKNQAERQKDKARDATETWKAKGRDEAKAEEKAAQNREKLEQEQKELEKLKNKPIEGPASPDAALANRNAQVERQQAKVDGLKSKQTELDANVTQAREAKESARKTAVGEQDKAIRAMQDANKASKAAGQKEPYEGVNDLKGAADLASRPRAMEEKILGTRTAVTKTDAARADARRVEEAAKKGPAEAAAELRRQLKGNDDPAYRAELFKATEGAQEKALQDAVKSGDQKLLNQTVKSFGQSADMVGPEAVSQVGKSMQESASAGEIDFESEGWPMMKEAMKANADSAAGRNVSREVATSFRNAGDTGFDRANEIRDLHPKLKDFAAETTGQTRAREAAQVQTVAGEKEAATEQARSLNGQAKGQVEETEARAKEIKEQEGAKTKTVGGAKVTETSNARVTEEDGVTTIEKLNKKGEVTERTRVEQEGDSYKYENTTWSKGKAEQTRIESDGDSSYQQSIRYNEKPSANPGAAPSVEDIKAGKVEGATLEETSFQREDNGDLTVRNYSQDKSGISETTKEYGQQTGTEGVDGDLDDKFDDGPVDTVRTKTVTIPAPGTKDSEGNPAKPTVTEQRAYSQGDVKATSTETTTPEDFEDSGWDNKPLNADTLNDVRSRGEDIIAEDDPEKHPKQWTLDVNKGTGKMQSQTFVEGQPNLTSITTREAHGSSVRETTTTKFPEEEGKASETTSSSTTKFDEYGRTVNKHVESEDREGVRTVQDFNMERKETKDGIVYTESGKTTITDADGNTSTHEKETRQLMGAEGPQLLSSKSKVTDPNGNVSTAEVDQNGSSYTINGRKIDASDLQHLPEDQQQTAAGALSSTLTDVKRYAGYGNSGLGLVSQTLDAFADKKGVGGSAKVITTSETADGKIKALERMAGTDALSKANRIASGVVQFAGAGTSALGAVANGASFVNNLQEGNIPGAVVDAVQTFTSAKGTFTGIKGGVETMRLGNGKVLTDAALDAAGHGGGLSGKITQAMNAFGDSGFGKFMRKFGGPLAIADAALSGYKFGKTLLDANATTYQKVQAGIGFGGAVTAIAVGAAVGGPAGAAVGALIGLGTIGVQAAVDFFTDDEHQLAEVSI